MNLGKFRIWQSALMRLCRLAQKRRLLLGRALYQSTGSLLLDEPTRVWTLRAPFSYLKTLRRLMLTGRTVVLVNPPYSRNSTGDRACRSVKAGKITAEVTSLGIVQPVLSSLFGEPKQSDRIGRFGIKRHRVEGLDCCFLSFRLFGVLVWHRTPPGFSPL
ncbi:MAG: hypothetical protein CM1200mP18_22540 [Gammaproteobacteria bacterium]|nr:MAG: hypothetical protein CM1200mP18_22540 [Gammaproteobacteria bacterium]